MAHGLSGSGISAGSASPDFTKMYHFKSFSGSSGTNFIAGFYDLTAADLNLTDVAATGTTGSANVAYGAHAILVASGVGTASGGTTGTADITVSGTSVTDAGVRTAGDSEVIIADVTDAATMAVDTYHETVKKWIGQVTYTIATTGDRTTFTADFNVGLVKYDHFWNRNVTITHFEIVGLAGANDTSFNVLLCVHSSNGWSYSAAAFTFPTGNVIVDMNTDYSTEQNLANGDDFGYERDGLSTFIAGSNSSPTINQPNGALIQIITGANGSVQSMDAYIGADLA